MHRKLSTGERTDKNSHEFIKVNFLSSSAYIEEFKETKGNY